MVIITSPEFKFDEVQLLYTSCRVKYNQLPPILKKEQAEGIHAILNRQDLLLLLPTNYGKSLVFTVPGILFAQHDNHMTTTVIVSPLTSLIKDGMERLRILGLSSFHCVLTSATDGTGQRFIDNARSMAEAQYIFVSPEVMRSKIVKHFIFELSPCLVAVDEGHLASEWGKEFRKDYAVFYELRTHVECPLAVFSATLTPDMVLDVKRKTGLNPAYLVTISASPDRPNIFLQVNNPSKSLSVFDVLATEIQEFNEKTDKTIIFVTTVQSTADILLYFENKLGEDMAHSCGGMKIGYYVNYYSAATEPEAKNEILKEFRKENGFLRVLICTVAFGLGVNIPNVRRVYIWGMPSSVMSLWQQIGRAGRDGLPSYAYIIPFQSSMSSLGHDEFKFPANGCIREFILSHFVGGKVKSNDVGMPVQGNMHLDVVCPGCRCCSSCAHNCSTIIKQTSVQSNSVSKPPSVLDLLLLK